MQDFQHSDSLPLVGVNTRVAHQVRAPAKSLVAAGECTGEGAFLSG